MSSLGRYWRAEKLAAVRVAQVRDTGSQIARLPKEEQERIRKQYEEFAARMRRGRG